MLTDSTSGNATTRGGGARAGSAEGDAGPQTGTASGAGDSHQHDTTVLVRYFASARAAAGVEQEQVRFPAATTIADAVAELERRHPDGLPKVLEVAGFLVDGVAVRDTSLVLPDGAELDVLPPFAGG